MTRTHRISDFKTSRTPPSRTLAATDAYVAGGAVRLVTAGWPPMRGRDFSSRVAHLAARHDHLRVALMHEPRGHEAMSGAILVEPTDPSAHAGLAFMHHSGWSAFCGHAAIGASAIAWRRGLVHWPTDAPLRLETPAGLIEVRHAAGAREPLDPSTHQGPLALRCTTPEAWLVQAGVAVSSGTRVLSVDLAWCAGLYAFTDAEVAGVPLDLSRGAELAARARALREALGQQVLRALPASFRHLEGVVFVAADDRGEADLQSATVYGDGVVDRSPGGATTAALLSVLDGMGMLAPDRPLVHRGPRGDFRARLLSRTPRPDLADALRVELDADAHFTGEHTFWLEDGDPAPRNAR